VNITKKHSSQNRKPAGDPSREAEVNSAIVELSCRILAAEGIEDISCDILEHAKRLTDSEFGFVGYIDPETGYMIAPTFTKDVWDICRVGNKDYIFKEFKGLWGCVLTSRRSLLTNDPDSHPHSIGTPEGHIPIRRFLSAPAMIGDELVGQIALANSSREYTYDDLLLTEKLASLFATVVHGKRSEDKLVHSLEALQAVYNIATTLRGTYESLCDEVVLNLAKFLKVSSVSIQHIEDDRARIISRVAEGVLSHDETSPLKDSPGSIALDAKKPYQVKTPGSLRSHVAAPVLSSDGRLEAFICVTDYNDRTFSEDELRLLEIFAKQVSYELDRDAMERKLRHLDKMTLLGQLAAGVAHEVRNPLNAILAVAEALFQDIKDIGENPDYYKPFLGHIRTQVDRLSNLMGDLLDLGKPIQAAGFQTESVPEICRATIDLWKQTPLSRSHKVLLVTPSEEKGLCVRADSARLQQVFFNVLENACHHSPEGSEIQFVICFPKGQSIHVQIVDPGGGVAPENLARVFEPFFTSRKKGTGLGLSIVKHIVQAHGGAVSIWNNNPPPGCTVQITLPLFRERPG
jgi:signal transduction histidine kinase